MYVSDTRSQRDVLLFQFSSLGHFFQILEFSLARCLTQLLCQLHISSTMGSATYGVELGFVVP
jgi:hypothetical protein